MCIVKQTQNLASLSDSKCVWVCVSTPQLLSSVQGASASANLRAAASSSARTQQQPVDGTHRHLHIRVTKARKFTEHLPVPGMPFSEVHTRPLPRSLQGYASLR